MCGPGSLCKRLAMILDFTATGSGMPIAEIGWRLNVGFYYIVPMRRAACWGPCLGGCCSWVGGLQACLWCSLLLVGLSWLSSLRVACALRFHAELRRVLASSG